MYCSKLMVVSFLASYIIILIVCIPRLHRICKDIISLSITLSHYGPAKKAEPCGTSVSCNPIQLFGLTTANQLAPALCKRIL